ncbi:MULTISPECIES: hypothetical protein [Streptomyces]|uniref:hypothetical protein n=1 Tax=Streptomyces TaxID=1883 RepID=UPI003414332C
MYRPSAAEERALGPWLSAEPSRYLATWINDPRRPLMWEVDHECYAPSGLVLRIWEEADWTAAPSAVQGTRCWLVPGEGTLAELAQSLPLPAEGDGDSGR